MAESNAKGQTALARLTGKAYGIEVQLEFETDLTGDVFERLVKLAESAKSAGWEDAAPQIVRGGGWGGGNKQTSKMVYDAETKRVKLYPAYPLVGVKGDKEATKAKREEFKAAIQAAAGKPVTVQFVWDKDNPKESYYWVGVFFAPALWQADYLKEWNKEPAQLPDEVING